MCTSFLHLLLADVDTDDCLFFKEALEELPVPARLTTFNDGAQLTHLLATKETPPPDALFRHLKMPRKGGIGCLSEIKLEAYMKELHEIIFSTSLNIKLWICFTKTALIITYANRVNLKN